MINYQKSTLLNGLTVITHQDLSSPLATVNMLYKVGSANEDPNRTGFAHLFEHLMFSGSKNAPDFDAPLQMAGGENNAFTTNDYTNYYITLPTQNLDTALWLESDRLLAPRFTKRALQTQIQVVLEEYNQRYLNQPYGDVQLLLRSLAYTTHPYRWPTIGADPKHIAQATLDDVKAFFDRFYVPENAILSMGSCLSHDEMLEKARYWFEDIPAKSSLKTPLPAEPTQTAPRSMRVQRPVPANALYMAFPAPARMHPDFGASDLISDLLANGRSARLYVRLVEQKALFSSIDAYLTADFDAGLMLISGKTMEGVSLETAEAAIWEELHAMQQNPVSLYELDKVKNKSESAHAFNETSLSQIVGNLAYCDMLGRIDLVNTEDALYAKIDVQDILRVSRDLFQPKHCNTLYYEAVQA